ncbi:MAG: biotin synthase [Rhodoferax sp.]
MSDSPMHPPTVDARAAQHWDRLQSRRGQVQAAWLHEEVGRRMAQRLGWMARPPAHWLHWGAWGGGLQGHALVQQQYPKAQWFLDDDNPLALQRARDHLAPPWWSPQRWRRAPARPAQGVGMVWSNMALHTAPEPVALLQRWHEALQVDGFVMFSCLGPDTLRELRAVYARQGWGEPSHAFTDMHDWGDLLVQCGFAEPVMDMERITLTYSSASAALAELRALGRNLHVQRFGALRGRGWQRQLLQAMDLLRADTPQAPGRLSLSFEVVYGHALKPAPRMAVQAQSAISLQQMRQSLGLHPTGKPARGTAE